MNSVSAQADPFVVLYGIPWGMYEKILQALGHYQLRHTYIEGTLEMRALLYGVEWEDYKAFLRALGDYSLRHTYSQGTLEMMAPRKDHDWVKSILGRFIEMMSLELGIDIQTIGSTTLTGDEVERGLQPDEAYYIANEPLVRGKDEFDPNADPPPDLVIEVDVTNTSVKRLPALGALGVPEVWRHDEQGLHFYRRSDEGDYDVVQQSVAFPFLTPDDVLEFLNQRGEATENEIVRSFVQRVRSKVSGQSGG